MRIIPAHAGFTTGAHGVGGTFKDHPRTRGVYRDIQFHGRQAVGSSPHTRGLLRGEAAHVGRGGIIPAHAGFTCGRTRPTRSDGDHPRTRGVYLAPPSGTALVRGSSPHTRGLLPPPVVGGGILRIIPAHAGFTQRYVLGAAESADHPRTRGVYPGDGDMTLG